jgi:actin-like ATPase involved in cell morphogenesis
MYTPKLKKELIEYFRDNYSVEVSEEEAEKYLDAIADFYIALVEDG